MVKIVTDTTASLTLEQYKQNGITAVPLYICDGNDAKKEVYEISYGNFYKLQRQGVKFTTSQPDPKTFMEVFQSIIEAGDEVVCVTISSGISGTINSANVAKQMLETDKVSIVDSMHSGYVQASLAIKAAQLAANGAGREEIVTALEEMRNRSTIIFMVENLRYLYEGGRLTGAQALVGSIIQIKPIISFNETGAMVPIEKIRTLKAARARILEMVAEHSQSGVETAALHYGDNFDEAAAFAKEMEPFVGMEVPLIKLSPVLGAHTGPDLLAPVIITKK